MVRVIIHIKAKHVTIEGKHTPCDSVGTASDGGTEKRMRLLAFGLQSDERYAPVVCSLSGDGPMGEIMREQGIPVFIHPKASRGLMIELVETAAE